MKESIKMRLATAGALLSVVGLVVAPVAVSAVSDNDNTTVQAVIDSVISMTTSGTVTINITPVSGGSQSSSSDTVTVSTNNATGYNLKLKDADATLTLANGGQNIPASANPWGTPAALANNTWGYALGSDIADITSGNNFDATAAYSTPLANVTTSTTKWAAITAADQTLRTTSTTASSHVTTVYYSAKADTSKPNGTYSDIVTYTATTN